MPGVRNVELVIFAALVLSAPSLLQAFSGGIGLPSALVHLTFALALCWAGGAIIERVIDTYSREARRRENVERLQRILEAQARVAEQAGVEHPQ
jgi:hypothetical protein